MPQKRMLIVDAEVIKKIDENRGDMSRSEFINFLIESRLEEDLGKQDYVTREEFAQSQHKRPESH